MNRRFFVTQENTMNEPRRTIGVVVARFQIDRLHEGQQYLLDLVSLKHSEMMIVLGTGSGFANRRDPLSYEARRIMLKKAYPLALVLPLPDHPSDEEWSRTLDELVEKMGGGQEATLYGSRESFLRVYTGKLRTERVPTLIRKSATEARKRIGSRVGASAAFRRGVIHVHESRAPITYPAVDTAVLRGRDVLLAGKKTDGGKLRFIGGFVDPADASYEVAAKREVIEETSHIEVDDFRYAGSARIDDWRYRGTGDGIMTMLFCATYIFGAPTPCDDIVRLEWVSLEKLMDVLVPEHRPLGELLLRALGREAETLESAA